MIHEKDGYTIFNHELYNQFSLNENANKVLQKGCKLLHDMGVPYWLSGGTALGIHRDKRFIPEDTDIDVEIIGNVMVNPIFNNFSIDFELVREVRDNDNFIYQQAYYELRSDILFDIFYYKKVGDKLISWSELTGEITYPISFINKIQNIKFEGAIYPMINPEEYLPWIYGKDWNTPIEKNKVVYSWGKE